MTEPSPSVPTDAIEAGVEKTRAYTGMTAVILGDVAIIVAAVLAVVKLTSSDTTSTAIVSVLTSAFTAIATMTTAYLGIKAASNTAQSSLVNNGSGNTNSNSGGAGSGGASI